MSKRVVILGSICALVLLIVWVIGGQAGWDKFRETFAPEIGGGLISFLAGILIWEFIGKKEREEEVAQLNEQIAQLTSTTKIISEKVSFIERKSNINNTIFGIIKKQDEKIKDLILHYTRAHPFVGRFYSKIMLNYHENFSISNNGFHIKDEYLSLSSYVAFWNYMVLAQKERNDVGEKCLIARIVHSNSVHIWTNEHSKYKEFTNKLLKLQNEFIESNGKVVRIFIGPDQEPNADYQIALNKMAENKIEGKYIKQSEYHKLPYDFLLLHDEKFVLKWNSDASGISLAGTVIQDYVEPEVEEKWEDMYEELKRLETPIVSIPLDREFRVKKRTI